MKRWKQAGAFVKPKGILIHLYNPHGVTNAVQVGSIVPW